MRAAWFIGKFELLLNRTKIKIIHPNPAHRKSRNTLAATACLIPKIELDFIGCI
jgi:hypothetical protein